MFIKLIKNKIILSMLAITSLMLISLSIYIPKVTEQNTIDLVVKNSINAVEQIKLTREYYVKEVVGDIKKYAPNIKFDYEHSGIDGKIAFPTSVIHELSDIYTKNTGLEFKLFSRHPFKPKETRILTPIQEEALLAIEKNDSFIWQKRAKIDGKDVLIVAIADVMNQKACVDCHNTHKDKTWDFQWKLGDKRGILEVITPLDESLEANNIMKNKILFFIFVAMVVLIIFYSYSLIRREEELLDENELLDERVKKELEKNIQKEKQLIQQSRSAAMGDMMGAIIHQWKQPLSGISMLNSSMELEATMGTINNQYVLEQTEQTKKHIDVMNTTMNDFKNFFKPQNALVYDINACIENTLKLVGDIYKKDNIIINTDYKEDIYTIGYSNELNQVIINILNNARDIIVEKDSQIKVVFIKTFKTKNNAIMQIKDCASGVPEHIIDKIFEPYVTTKSENKGTGIGLDMSKVIIEKVDGTIKVDNIKTTIDKKDYLGAMFTISLPIATKES